MFAYQRSFVLEQKPFERDKRRATRRARAGRGGERGREERIKNKAFIPDSLFAANSKRDASSLVARRRRSAISINLRIC